MTIDTEEILQALGEIKGAVGELKGTQRQTLTAVENLRADFVDHKGDDRNNFQAVASRFGSIYTKLDEQDDARALAFKRLEDRLNVINGYIDNIKGAWWIVTILAIVVGGAGAAVAWAVGLLKHGG